MNKFTIRRLPVSVVVPEDTSTATTVNLTDLQINGRLVGVVIVVPSMTDTETKALTQNITVSENLSLVRT